MANPDKCQFGLDFLGHCITPEGATPMPDKVEAIQNLPKLSTTKSLQEFLVLVNFYHHFLPGAATLMQPLFNLVKLSDKTLQWTPDTSEALHSIKAAMARAIVLVHPNSTSPWP
ncbi:uncharacterized protein [Narcine bancroftii]|uniref:uncharacterized protein n=1 Tax=Narcine bancroftii TaxID=1343680 RepID=UPI003831CA7F